MELFENFAFCYFDLGTFRTKIGTLKVECFVGRNFRDFANFSFARESLHRRNCSFQVVRESLYPRNFLKFLKN